MIATFSSFARFGLSVPSSSVSSSLLPEPDEIAEVIDLAVGHVHDMEGLGETYVGYDDITPRSTKLGFSGLRCGKTLKPGFVVTDEPGIYFIPTLIDLWKAEGKFKEFINYDKLETYKDFGGIRIEDDLLITEDGCRILGRPIPKTVEEVESMCAQGREWIKMTAMY